MGEEVREYETEVTNPVPLRLSHSSISRVIWLEGDPEQSGEVKRDTVRFCVELREGPEPRGRQEEGR